MEFNLIIENKKPQFGLIIDFFKNIFLLNTFNVTFSIKKNENKKFGGDEIKITISEITNFKSEYTYTMKESMDSRYLIYIIEQIIKKLHDTKDFHYSILPNSKTTSIILDI